MHQGCTTEATPTGAGGATAGPAGAGLPVPPIGKPELWRKLAMLRKNAAQDWPRWSVQAAEFYPRGGPALDAALEQLIANVHWRDLPGPGRAPARGSLAGMDYGRGFA